MNEILVYCVLDKSLELLWRHQLSIMQQFGESAFYMVVRWLKQGEVDNECILHISIVLAICVPKIIKFSQDLTKFWQKHVGSFFGTPCISDLAEKTVVSMDTWQDEESDLATGECAPPNPSQAGWYLVYLFQRNGRLSWSDLSTKQEILLDCDQSNVLLTHIIFFCILLKAFTFLLVAIRDLASNLDPFNITLIVTGVEVVIGNWKHCPILGTERKNFPVRVDDACCHLCCCTSMHAFIWHRCGDMVPQT